MGGAVTPDQERKILSMLSGERPMFLAWVTKLKGGSKQKRVLVVGETRILTFRKEAKKLNAFSVRFPASIPFRGPWLCCFQCTLLPAVSRVIHRQAPSTTTTLNDLTIVDLPPHF